MSNIAIVVSKFNQEISNKLLAGALEAWYEKYPKSKPKVVWVPGAVEIPVTVASLIDNYSAILTLGSVINGETRHFDYVCKIVSEGCLNLALVHKKPVIFGVLTTENFQQALDRSGGSKGNKGYDCMLSAFEMVDIMRSISG